MKWSDVLKILKHWRNTNLLNLIQNLNLSNGFWGSLGKSKSTKPKKKIKSDAELMEYLKRKYGV
nr:MAG TPA: hypothetical protein [Caudoviricetes sp.]